MWFQIQISDARFRICEISDSVLQIQSYRFSSESEVQIQLQMQDSTFEFTYLLTQMDDKNLVEGNMWFVRLG